MELYSRIGWPGASIGMTVMGVSRHDLDDEGAVYLMLMLLIYNEEAARKLRPPDTHLG
jgi:hypothetical protein